MISKLKIWGVLLTLTATASCYKDKGNYDYNAINEPREWGLEATYTTEFGKALTIKPAVKWTMATPADTTRYSYEWQALYMGAGLPAEVRADLGFKQNLELVQVTIKPGNWQVYYRILDKTTGVKWQKQFVLTVTSPIYEGWLLLNEVGGKSRLDMISKMGAEWRVIPDVLKTVGSKYPDALNGKPNFVRTWNYEPSTYGIHISTDKGTTRIHPETFDWDNTYRIQYEFISPISENFSAYFLGGISNIAYVLGNDNHVYYYERPQNIRYSVPVNMMVTEGATKPVKISNWVAFNEHPIFPALCMFDTEKRRFIRNNGREAGSIVMPSGSLFNFNNTGLDLVWMGYSQYNSGNVFAIMKKPDEAQYKLARFTFAGSINQVYYDDFTPTDVAQATNYCVSPNLGYVFYNVSGKLYSYDFNLKASKLMLDLGSRQISLLQFYGNDLLVFSYDPAEPTTSGHMDSYTVAPVQGDLVRTQHFEGVGKVVSAAYRRR